MTNDEKEVAIQYISKLLQLVRANKIEALTVSQNMSPKEVFYENGPVYETMTFYVTYKGPTPEMIEQHEKEEMDRELKELERLKLKYES